jgi:hypothetical protein
MARWVLVAVFEDEDSLDLATERIADEAIESCSVQIPDKNVSVMVLEDRGNDRNADVLHEITVDDREDEGQDQDQDQEDGR